MMTMIEKLRHKTYTLLRKSERFFKTDMVYLAKGGFWLTLGQTISALLSLVLVAAFANLLTREDYGTYQYILSLASIIGLTTLPGLSTAVIRSVAQGKEGVLDSTLKKRIRFGIIGSIISFSIGIYYLTEPNQTLGLLLIILGLFIPIYEPFNVYGAFLEGKKRFDVLTKYRVKSQLIASSTILASLFFTKNIVIIVGIYFLSWTIVRYIFFKKTISKFKPNNHIDEDIFTFGKHLTFVEVLNVIAGNLDKILLWHFVGAQAVAVYTLAIKPVTIIKGYLKSLGTLALPKLSQRDIPTLKETLPQKSFKLFIILVVLVLMYICIAPVIFDAVFPQYKESIPLSQFFALSILFMSIRPIGRVFSAHMKTREIYIVNILNSIILLTLYLLLLPRYGMWGIVASKIIKEAVSTVIIILLFKKLS